ncbi:MAG: hypothetical protein IT434_11015 [Phycisphaerales bacterium]|jgi:hypothetical protein|nr:hypothetical protein [Phycisphaerales bacterium]
MDGSTRKFGRVATGALACAALVGSLASCSPPPPKAAPSYPLVDTAIYDDRARELIRERGIELLAHGAQPAWWTSLTELSGNVATIPASGAAGDLQVALALAGRNAKAAATELLGTEPLTIEFVHSACRRTDAGQIEAMVLARALGPARAQVQAVPIPASEQTKTAVGDGTGATGAASPGTPALPDGVERPAWWFEAPKVGDATIEACAMGDGPTLREARNAALAKGAAALSAAAGKSVSAGETQRVATARLPDGSYRAFVLMSVSRR